MKIVFSSDAWEDYLHWQGKDKDGLKKINELVRDILRDPDSPGLGKPERLKGDLAGYSSRRISAEHRLVYRATEEQLIIIQCRYYY